MLVFITIFRLFSEAQMAESVDLLTQGGPFGATQLVGTYANQLAFTFLDFAKSEALATGTGAVLLVVALAGLALVHRPAFVRCGRVQRVGGLLRHRFQATRSATGASATPVGATEPARRRRTPAIVAWFGVSQRRTHRLVVVALVVGAALTLFPVIGGLPGGALRPDFGLVWSQVDTGLANSGVMAAGTLVGTLLMAAPAAYVLARCRFPGRSTLFGLVLLAMAIPGALTLFPQAQGLVHLGLMNTRVGVMLIYIAADLPLAVFFLRATFAAVP